jgi:biotin carboxyl carrier protein
VYPPRTEKGQKPTLKTYQIDVNGQAYTVEIDDPNASPVHVLVNGKPFEVTIAQNAFRQHEPQVPARPAKSDGPTDRVYPHATGHDLLLETYVPAVASTYVEVAPEPEPVDAQEPTTSASGSLSDGEGTETVTAPMPGTILDIAVKAGEVVRQGDILCNLEAMKMKSPIRSPSEGTVVNVLITEGQNVGYGDVLFTLG